jgi:hypothetical protein
MGHAWMWRTGLVLLALVWGCEERRPSVESRTPSPVESSQPTTSESPEPKRGDAHEDSSDAGADSVPDAGPTETEAAGIPGSVFSSDRRFAMVVPGGDRVRHIEVYDVASHRRLTRITIDKSIVVRSTRARVRWTVGNHILLTWSAGSDTATGIVYGTDGKTLLEVEGSGMVTSPSLRYLATYPTVFAEPPIIEVYDLSLARKVAERAASEGTFWVVENLAWKGQQFVALCRDLKEQTQEVRIELDALP